MSKPLWRRGDAGLVLTAAGLICGLSTASAWLSLPSLASWAGCPWPLLVLPLALLVVLSVTSLLATALTDPGCLPRNLHPAAGETTGSSVGFTAADAMMPSLSPVAGAGAGDGGGSDVGDRPTAPFPPYQPSSAVEAVPSVPADIPLPKGYPFISVAPPASTFMRPVLADSRTIAVGHSAAVVRVRYCHTCHIWRPPRASHCSICDRCVSVHDHHCPWMANCVGARNYRFFFAFLWSTLLLDLLVCAQSLAHISLLVGDTPGGRDWGRVIADNPGVTCIAVFTFFISFSMTGMVSYHSWLTAMNLTTREHIKQRAFWDDVRRW